MTIFSFLNVLAQSKSPEWPQMVLLFGGVIFIFYFFMIRPEKKKQNAKRRMLETTGKKDKVVIAGGIYGTVKNVGEKTITIIVDENTGSTLKVSKQAIMRNITAQEKSEGSDQTGKR